jgi:hypothetical protein
MLTVNPRFFESRKFDAIPLALRKELALASNQNHCLSKPAGFITANCNGRFSSVVDAAMAHGRDDRWEVEDASL